jgi:ubiquitin C-terminal hydrolase
MCALLEILKIMCYILNMYYIVYLYTMVVGLQNIGNTCFMNSALQVILNCDKLNDAVIKSPCNTPLIDAYRDLVKKYRDCKESEIIIPKTIKKVMGKKYGIFGGYQQQDSHEFLSLLLLGLESELKEQSINNIVGEILDVKVNIIVSSKETDKTSSHYENTTILPLDLPTDNQDTCLGDCINNYMSEHSIDEPVKFEVKDNNKKKIIEEQASQEWIIEELSEYFMVQFKRFNQSRNMYSKKSNNVHVPHTLETENSKYTLKSFIVQSGTLGGGHYISFVRDGECWKCANDSSILDVPVEQINEISQKAYILCYDRV